MTPWTVARGEATWHLLTRSRACAASRSSRGSRNRDLEQIASHLIERRYPRNTTIVEEGLPGDYMYILRDGRVKVTKLSEDGREKILDFLEAGSFVGEMALLERGPRSASVKTLSPVRVLALSRTDFIALLRKSPDLALAVIQELSRRLRSVNEQASSLSFQRVKERTMGLLERLAKDPSDDGERLITPVAHAPADRRHGRHLARDRDARGEGPEGDRLAAPRG